MRQATRTRRVSNFGPRIVAVLLALAVHAGAQTESVLYSFESEADGAEPVSGLVQDGTGALYGTTDGAPSVYKLTPPTEQGGQWAETEIYNFPSFDDGVGPANGYLVLDAKGNLYGTTAFGGLNGYGTVFELSPPSSGETWDETVLYYFQAGGKDAQYPTGVILSGGALYGTTTSGGQFGEGAVFRLTPGKTGGPWKETVLYSFTGGSDGGPPVGTPTPGPGGVLYGATSYGGLYANGVVYQLSPPAKGSTEWTEKVLHNFGGSTYDGLIPSAALVLDKNGSLYGPTFGSIYPLPYGLIYKLTPPAWKETILYNFTDGADGEYPESNMIFDDHGALYGTTSGSYSGGTNHGSVFKLAPPRSAGGAWTETTLHSFSGGSDGGTPGAGLLLKDGILYGTTFEGGPNPDCNCGIVFSIKP
jgi:uncharacterized repeat protein (TIGR03803 family)